MGQDLIYLLVFACFVACAALLVVAIVQLVRRKRATKYFIWSAGLFIACIVLVLMAPTPTVVAKALPTSTPSPDANDRLREIMGGSKDLKLTADERSAFAVVDDVCTKAKDEDQRVRSLPNDAQREVANGLEHVATMYDGCQARYREVVNAHRPRMQRMSDYDRFSTTNNMHGVEAVIRAGQSYDDAGNQWYSIGDCEHALSDFHAAASYVPKIRELGDNDSAGALASDSSANARMCRR